MITSSNITFTGSNTFKNNIAINGGAIYLYGSVLIMQVDGANSFTNNSIKRYKDSCSTCNLVQQIEANHGCGGAVYSIFSTIWLTGQSKVTFSENKALPTTGDHYYYAYQEVGDHLLKLTLFHTNDTFSQCIISMEIDLFFAIFCFQVHHIKKIGQHHFLCITSYAPIPNIQVYEELCLSADFAQKFIISIYGKIGSVPLFRVNISSTEACKKKNRAPSGT